MSGETAPRALTLETLNQRHPDVDGLRAETILDYSALYEGGEAVQRRVVRLLPRRPSEEEAVYRFRCSLMHYVNYTAEIVDYFKSHLFASDVEIRTEGSNDTPPWYGDWAKDVDRSGSSLVDFFACRFVDASVARRSWFLVDFPLAGEGTVETRAEWEGQALGNGYLVDLPFESVLDWSHDDAGELEYVVVKSEDRRRRDPTQKRGVVRASWTIYQRDGWQRYAIDYEEAKPPQPKDLIPLVQAGAESPTPGHVPIVCMDFGKSLWLLNKIASPQMEQMRKRNDLSWGLGRSCFAMRVFNLAETPGGGGEDSGGGSGPRQGPGYSMILGVGETVSWDAPPSDAFTPIAQYAENLKEEIHRIAGAMALSMTTSAASVGRSGESKAMDIGGMERVLRGYGDCVLKGIRRAYLLLSIGRKEPLVWAISGFDSFDESDASQQILDQATWQTLDIPSPTAQKLRRKAVAFAACPGASQAERDQIDSEIEKATPMEPSSAAGAMLALDDAAAAQSDTASGAGPAPTSATNSVGGAGASPRQLPQR